MSDRSDELPLDGEPGTVYPVLWDEEKRADLVRNVPAEAAEVVAIASDMFSVTHRVWKIERHLGVAATFLLGAAKALESPSFFHDKGDIPHQLREVVRRVNIAEESFDWTMNR